MTIPSDAKAFDRWLDEQDTATWPDDLRAKAKRASLTFHLLEGNPPSVIQALEKNAPETWAGLAKDLLDFAEAYGAFVARPGGTP